MLALFETFLGALCDPERGEELHRMHAPDAIVRYARGIGPASDIHPASFASRHREVSLRGEGVLPNFRCTALLAGPEDSGAAQAAAGGTTTVAWFGVTETREQHRFVAALGLRASEGKWLIGWSTFAKLVEDWSYADGLLQSLADYDWMLKGEPTVARALLDASYFRLHWRSAARFSTLPGARFSCHMSSVCCKHDFEIPLPPEAQLVIDAMPWQSLEPRLAGTRLPVRPDGKLQLKSLNETCRFLGARNQCLIHQTLGRQPFGPCSVFPFAFAETPDGVAVSLSPICGSARMGLGVSPHDREDDLRERLAHVEPRKSNGFRLTPGAEISWERFRDIERGLCECIGAEDLPMRRRLYVGSRLLAAMSNGEALDTHRWLAEPPVAISDDLREAIRGMLGKILGWDRAALHSIGPVPTELSGLEVQEPRILAVILQNALFGKAYSYPYDLTTAHNFLIVLYLLALVMQEKSAGPLSETLWRELGSLGVHGLLKSVLHDGVPDGFRSVFGTAEFGLWMLAA